MKLRLRNLLLLILMAASAGLAYWLRPEVNTNEQASKVDLQVMIPEQFGTWSSISTSQLGIVNPQQQEALDRLYSQVLARSYRDSITGRVVMLSMAYGSEQSKQSQVHRPEVCYPSQGFQIIKSHSDQINAGTLSIPVKRLVARLDQRIEPITYWIRIGDIVARGWLEQKIAVVINGFYGRITSGLLFRISTLDDSATSYELQDRFVVDLLPALSPATREFLLGRHQ